VNAKPHWTDSGLSVQVGQPLRISAAGEWTDWTIRSGPESYAKAAPKPFEGLRRVPGANWFAPIGCVEKSLAHHFVVGRGGTFTAPATGRLYFFANDVSFMHWNNKGHVDVVIEVEHATE